MVKPDFIRYQNVHQNCGKALHVMPLVLIKFHRTVYGSLQNTVKMLYLNEYQVPVFSVVMSWWTKIWRLDTGLANKENETLIMPRTYLVDTAL